MGESLSKETVFQEIRESMEEIRREIENMRKTVKKWIIIVIILALAGILVGTTVGYLFPIPTKVSEMPLKSWHSLRTFTGTGEMTTDNFSIESDTFRIIYRALPTEEGMLESWFGFKLYYVGETEPVLEAAQTTPLVDTLYVIGEKAGSYYLEVLTWKIEQWIIEIQSYD